MDKEKTEKLEIVDVINLEKEKRGKWGREKRSISHANYNEEELYGEDLIVAKVGEAGDEEKIFVVEILEVMSAIVCVAAD